MILTWLAAREAAESRRYYGERDWTFERTRLAVNHGYVAAKGGKVT